MKFNKKSRRSLSMALTLTVMLSNVMIGVNASPNDEIIADVNENNIVIGNSYLTREFSINNGKIITSEIQNSRANTNIIPQEGSEDFVINTVQGTLAETPEPEVVIPTEVLNRELWSATLTSSNGTEFTDASVEALFDGDNSTYVNEYQKNGYPISLVIDLGESKNVSSFSYQKRPGYHEAAYGKNGTMGSYKVYVSGDGVTWTEAGSGEFTEADYKLHEADGLYNVGELVYGNLSETYETRYIKIDQLSDALGSTQEFTGAEVNLYSDKYSIEEAPVAPVDKSDIKSSDLTVEDNGIEVENIENGKKLTISYEPYTLNNIEYEIDMVTVVEEGDHYMRSFLEITTDNNEARIDYVELDRFVLDEAIEDTLWSHPDLSEVSSMWIDKHELMLGQPIYANGMFFGSEFPAADTNIVDEEMQIRYYSGKSFEELNRDHQLTVDGKFVSWQNVIGSAKGTETDVVQTDFFDYIDDIATPTEFRKQYNSWYDNMLGISADSIEASFYGSEKGLTENGVEPLDSYVVDDGWNNYRSENYNTNISVNDAGEGFNRTGFWEFNSKFPNELYTSAELVGKFQSNFGVWMGPQGGYNYFPGFADFIEEEGTGYAQEDFWKNVCVGSETYVNNLTELFIDYQERFDVDYWKIDGFAVRPCTSEDHDHMHGGEDDMYYTSDLWEKWIDAFEAMRANREAEGKDLFINATCYVNVSPWLLQWVNTVWVQDSGDTGEAGTGDRFQQKITYRDNVYYNIYEVNELQFPLKNIYNHDPIYGVSDGSNTNTENFRDFLFANAVRGTAFWELYYSPSIMDDEKWQVNADALAFAEENFHILENAKMFGARATEGVYGYSAWEGNEGIVSFRNPTGEELSYTLELTDIVGVPTGISNLKGHQVHPYVVGDTTPVSYGDEITVNLAPYETRIIQYGNLDSEPASIVSAKVTGDNEITIKYNERVENGEDVYSVEDTTVVSSELLADYRTVVITTEDNLVGEATVNIDGERDEVGNGLTTSLIIPVYNGEEIISVTSNSDLVGGDNIAETYNSDIDTFLLELDNVYEVNSELSFTGTTDFAINAAVKTTSSGVELVNQGDDIQLSIDEDGFVNFRVKDLSVNSKNNVTTVIEKAYGTFGTDEYVPTSSSTEVNGIVNDGELHNIVAVRESNGMLKIYIDGNLVNSSYDEALINQNVENGVITIGDSNFEGTMGDIKLLNNSIYYDEVAEDYENYDSEVVIEYSRENWTAEACSEMGNATGDGPASSAIDGNEGTWWHSNYLGQDNHEGDHWISVDFEEELEMDTVTLVQRGAGANGTVKDYKLEANINGEWVVVKEGTIENANRDDIELDEAITAGGIKITVLSTFNGNDFAAIKEIYVSNTDRNATEEEIQEVLDLVEDINESNYTTATVNNYKQIAKKIESLEVILTTRLESLKNQLLEAKEILLESADLNELMTKVGTLEEEVYTTESWSAVVEALNNANSVVNNINSTRVNIDEAFKMLNDSIEALEESDITVVDKDQLGNLIQKVKEYEDLEDKYIETTWSNLQVRLDEAKEVYVDANATQEEVKISYENLMKAYLSLRLIPDKTLLEELIDRVEGLIEADYTEESYNNLMDALESAVAIYENKEATEEEVIIAQETLKKAVENLEKVEDKEDDDSVDVEDNEEELPQTGGTSSVLLALIGIGVIGTGLILNKKKKTNLK